MAKAKSVLITGAAGFIASHLTDSLLSHGFKVIGVDNFSTGKKDHLKLALKNRKFEFIDADVNSEKFLNNSHFNSLDIDFIYHYAACVGVNRTLAHPLLVLSDIEGFKNILKLSNDKKVQRLFYSSSSEVYGESVSFPQNEHSTPLNAKLPYAAIKNLGEIYIKTYHQEFGLPYTIFRFFNTYGPRQSESFVVSKFIRQALSNQPISVYGQGHQTRSFMYIDDNIQATVKALTSKKTENKIINVGNPQEIEIIELANLIIKQSHSQSVIQNLPPLPEGDMPRRVADITLMKNILKTSDLTPLETGLKKTLEYFKNI